MSRLTRLLTVSAIAAAAVLAVAGARSIALRAAVPPDLADAATLSPADEGLVKSALSDEAPAKSGEGFVEGALELKSAGALAFGPDGVLFVGDSRGGAVYGLAVDDRTPDPHKGEVEINDIDKRIAKLLETPVDQVVIRDMAVNPATQHLFFSVARGRGPDAAPALVRSTLAGELSIVPLDAARYSKLALVDAPNDAAKTPWGASSRAMAITDLAFTNGELFIAGLSNEAFASTLRRAKFPFAGGAQATTVEIFHTSHGKYETAAPIESMLPYTVKGKPALLAGYGCAPLAAFEMASLGGSKHVRGRTLAELGGGSRPSDMVAVEKNGQRYVIIANSNRTVMSLKSQDIDKAEALEKQSTEIFESFGAPYRSMAIIGVIQLDVLNPDFIVMVKRDIETGSLNVRTFATKWL
jgi:hypothetical protein